MNTESLEILETREDALSREVGALKLTIDKIVEILCDLGANRKDLDAKIISVEQWVGREVELLIAYAY